MSWNFRFHDGTLVVEGASSEDLPSGFVFDSRVQAHRGAAFLYPKLVYSALERKIPYNDAKRWNKCPDLLHRAQKEPRDYQREAIGAWCEAGYRGTVVLPTGSGKSFVAELIVALMSRPTLVVAPTLDLVGQWYDVLRVAFNEEIGIVGGGHHQLERITVTTYDSAHIHLPRYGDRFALLIFDEVHHLPAPAYLEACKASMAPFRLGLTATLEREDGRERLLEEYLGPVVYRQDIGMLSGEFLSEYETIRILIDLSESEKNIYKESREEYLQFLRDENISMGGFRGWQNFLRLAARSKRGRSAFLAHQRAKKIAHGADSKLQALESILKKERGRRTIIFSNDNATAYMVSQRYLVPCITHQTPVKERRALIKYFGEGVLPIIATSRVLNEGVDIPSAEVAIVLSGTGTVREHVQRLGRILRPAESKKAVLYELVSAQTSEEFTSERRRRHDAYQ